MSGLTVEHGEVTVNSHRLVVDHPDVKIWEVDLRSKYAEVAAIFDTEVWLEAGPRTLLPDESRRGTFTKLRTGVPEDWQIIAEAARYTVRIVAWDGALPEGEDHPSPDELRLSTLGAALHAGPHEIRRL